jgi:hypothetical protein
MRFFRALLAFVLIVTAARAGEVSLLKGDVLKGDILSVTDKEVVIKQGDKQVRKPIAEVLKIDFRDVSKPPSGKTYSQVELTDGTVVLVGKWGLKKKTFEMTLLSGPAVTLPVNAVANVLNNAQVEDHRREWKTRVFNTRGKEAIVDREDKTIFNILSTLGEGDDKGEVITFVAKDDESAKQRRWAFAKMHGLIFKHTLEAKAPPVLCKLTDTIQDLIMVASVTPRAGGLTVTTPSGAKIDFTNEQIARLDYSTGKLDFLSDLEPTNREIRPNPYDTGEARERWFIYKDTNLYNKPIRLGGASFAKGLTLLPEVELTYDLKGEYREFSATVGIDDETKGEGEVALVIEGDGKELTSVPIVYRTEKTKTGETRKPPRPVKTVTLNIKDVQKLKVILKAKDELNGLSMSVSLGNAKVNK